MPTLPKTDPALHLLIPDFLIYLAQYPANYAIPSTLFAPPTDHKPPSDDNESADSPRAQGGISSIRTRPDIRVDFLSVTRSEGEITILYSIPYAHASSSSGDGSAVGEGINGTSDGAALEEKQKAALQMLKLDEPDEGDGPYAAIRVQGPLDLSLTGILAALSDTLRSAEVPIFAISTWNTDYILVRHALLSRAKQALSADGWKFVAASRGS